MGTFTPLPALAGGALIGIAASLLLWGDGQVAGVSGVWARVLQGDMGGSPGESGWRPWFLAGLVAGGLGLALFAPTVFAVPEGRGLASIALSGVLVGVGTRLGSGCTSGHGVCGLSRGSTRSLAAVMTFMGTGFLTATLLGLVGGAP